jgi:hypothetical protein
VSIYVFRNLTISLFAAERDDTGGFECLAELTYLLEWTIHPLEKHPVNLSTKAWLVDIFPKWLGMTEPL